MSRRTAKSAVATEQSNGHVVAEGELSSLNRLPTEEEVAAWDAAQAKAAEDIATQAASEAKEEARRKLARKQAGVDIVDDLLAFCSEQKGSKCSTSFKSKVSETGKTVSVSASVLAQHWTAEDVAVEFMAQGQAKIGKVSAKLDGVDNGPSKTAGSLTGETLSAVLRTLYDAKLVN